MPDKKKAKPPTLVQDSAEEQKATDRKKARALRMLSPPLSQAYCF